MRQPGAYAWLGLVVSLMASIGLNVLITINLAERAAEGQRRSSCEVAVTNDEIYKATPPQTDTGRAAARAWENARERWKCDSL